MSFWDEHATSEAEVKERERLPQNAPALCPCGHLGSDVLFGTCAACFARWSKSHGKEG